MNIVLIVIVGLIGLIGYVLMAGLTKSCYNDIDNINIFKYKIILTEKMTSVIALLWPLTFPILLIWFCLYVIMWFGLMITTLIHYTVKPFLPEKWQ